MIFTSSRFLRESLLGKTQGYFTPFWSKTGIDLRVRNKNIKNLSFVIHAIVIVTHFTLISQAIIRQ